MSNQILITTAKFYGCDGFVRPFLQARGFELIEHQLHREMDDAMLLRMVPPAAGLIAGSERVSDVVMAAVPLLRVVNAPGVGYDHYVPLPELIPAADFLSLHCPLTPETRGMIDADALARMKPTAYLINTARDPLVDQAALVEALREGRIAGAGIDVYDTEPLLENPYAGLDNVVQTPHCAGHSLEAIQRSLEMALENITRVLRGQEPLYRIN